MSDQDFLVDFDDKEIKKKRSLQGFLDQFKSLDANNYGAWPTAVKVTSWTFIVIFICILGYFVLIVSVMEDTSTAQAQEANLLNEYQQKDSKLRNSQSYKKQLTAMQAGFEQQLQQLPKESEIAGLVEDINTTGLKAGLKLKNIRLEGEIKQNFFVEQPITIEAIGDYHAFARFVSDIAVLSRIVTISDFSITAVGNKNGKVDVPELNYVIKAKTYRYLGGTQPVTNQKAGDHF
ncbi:type IV pilus inner membrane component PilO [Acinetobacter rathckeae]|uniref:type 4a pilus biogenesis protein PilO n=1 Tax=Acinetobacter rathckeae TaxID=2605272 RepID=UPI0018A2B2C7|nr:type 4a pilus biogenesis protein PilO [Acinetobacter rathckeae]MBF7688706.1 type 4a pilus biogenesis protein PilO [Acinetobacter rathckeae]MBF7696099.1 type 4a pilus biogenesis protein PilO [Acinetobacter rathckeae]